MELLKVIFWGFFAYWKRQLRRDNKFLYVHFYGYKPSLRCPTLIF